MYNLKVILVLFLIIPLTTIAQVKSNSSFVNPFIGASTSMGAAGSYHGLGKTFPGACVPFGMVQLSPNTITGGDNGSGYSYEHTSIEGFAFTQMSGVGWYGDLGNFLITPTSGALKTFAGRNGSNDGYRLLYNKNTEIAEAGYFAVSFEKPAIRAEMTAAPHSGIMRFTFPESNNSRIQIDLARRVGGTSVKQYINVVNDYTIKGYMLCTPEGGGWGNGAGNASYTVYFYAKFSKPLSDFGIWSADIPDNVGRKLEDIESEEYKSRIAKAYVYKGLKEKTGKHIGFYVNFDTKQKEQILLKAGISFTSCEGARKNLEAELPFWDFDVYRANAKELWDNALGKIQVESVNKEDKTIFYTALYHTMIDPRCVSDIDSVYSGGDGKVHKAGFKKRSIFSGWDVFRSQFPLQTIINPDVVNDEINSLITLAEENVTQYYDRWEFLNAYSGCMVGNPAIAVLTDAYVKGITRYDIEKGYNFAINTSKKFGNDSCGYSTGDLGISNTLEYAYSDGCMAILSQVLGREEYAKTFDKKAQAYKNIFNDSVGWFRLRNKDMSWRKWPEKGRMANWYGTIESNPYQQGWFVPHDTDGLAKLLGGKDKAIEDLEIMFKNTPDNFKWNSYYNHANEPVHHIPFLFNRFGAPWLTQKYSRKICANAYHNSVEGLVGNDDVGQMSAWYVLASIGLYQVCPGDMRFEITSPVFDQISIVVTNKKGLNTKFIIEVKDNSMENIYIQQAWLNGKPLNACYLYYNDIIKGGKLVLQMGNKPNKDWGKN